MFHGFSIEQNKSLCQGEVMKNDSLETRAALQVSKILQDTLAALKRKEPPFMMVKKEVKIK